MTATTAPTADLTTRGWTNLLWLAAGVVVAVVLLVGAFAIGRTTADTVEPAAPVAAGASSTSGCVPAVHTPPC